MQLVRKRNKRHKDWEEKGNFFTVDDMITYIKDPKKSTKKLELIGKFSKISGYRSTFKNQWYFFVPANEKAIGKCN